MSICYIGCNPSQVNILLALPEFSGNPPCEVNFPLTASDQLIDVLIAGTGVPNLTVLAASISDWNSPPAALFILPESGYASAVEHLHHHPRVGRSIFFCKDTPVAIQNGLGDVLRFFNKRKSLDLDNSVSGNYTSNNVSPRWLFQLMMEKLDEYIYFKDKDSRFLAVSRYLTVNCKKDSPEEILGLTDFEFFDRTHAEEAFSDERKIATGQFKDLYKEEKILKDGKIRWVASRKLPLHTRSKHLAGSFGLSRDITDEKEMQQRLEQNHERMQAELLLAKNLQKTLIQQSFPAFTTSSSGESLQIATRYVPSFHLSGDFFYVFKTGSNCAAVLLADVMGHGVRSAMVTAMIQIAVQELHAYADQPIEFMNHLNDMLHRSMQSTDQTIFATAVYCHLDLESKLLKYIQAGASHGILLQGDHRANPTEFDATSICPALGLIPQTEYLESSVQLASGDKVVLFTDGIVEAASGNEIFGEMRLKEFLLNNRQTLLPRLMDDLIGSVQSFTQNKDFEDDVCLVGLNLV